MYLSEDFWKKTGVKYNKGDVHFYSQAGVVFPACEKFNKALEVIIKEKGIDVNLGHALTKVDKTNRKATFKNSAGEDVVVDYDMLHITPNMSAHQFMKGSPISDAGGFVDVNHSTLQSKKYPNVFSVGDANNCPSAKTAAAVFSQTPVMIHNLLQHKAGKELNAMYDFSLTLLDMEDMGHAQCSPPSRK
jgi:NADH dehydrogenase FAD-containing subunit